MKAVFVLILAAVLLFTSSCGTIFTGTKQNVLIKSNPSGAKIQVDGVDRGTTPSNVQLKKAFKGQVITLTKDGYERYEFAPETTFNPVSILNLLGMVGWAIDAATGAMMKYDPTFYEVDLKPAQDQN